MVYDERNADYYAKECAIRFAARLSDIEGSRVVFSSFVMPGLGQVIKKRYIKGILYAGGFMYCLGKSIFTQEMKSTRFTTFSHYGNMYYIDGRPYPYEIWLQKREEYEDMKKEERIRFKTSLDNKRHKYALIAAAIYVINLVDAIFLSNDFENKEAIMKKLSVDYTSNFGRPKIGIRFRF